MTVDIGADPALVASQSNPQAVSTKGFDPGEAKEPSEFVWGYLIAVANIMHTHDNPTIAADVLGELGVEREVLDRMDLSDFDREPLNAIFDELDRR